LAAATLLVPAGAEVAIFGNAESFDHATTVVRYYNPAQRAGAEAMVAALGVGAPELQESQTDTVDVTVIVGRDFEAGGAGAQGAAGPSTSPGGAAGATGSAGASG